LSGRGIVSSIAQADAPSGKYADLHVHTDHSDGSDSPRRVVERAVQEGLAAIAITDHDTVSGLDAASVAARTHGIELIPGTEISASFGRVEVHVLGLGIDPDHPQLVEALEEQRAARSRRIDTILERLNALGIPLDLDDLKAQAACAGSLGRMHVAQALHARGVTRTVQEAFDKYLRPKRKAYVAKQMIGCRRAIDLIHEAGGVAFLGHPGLGATLTRLLPRLLDMPFDGIEVYHPKHTPGHVTQFTHVALERDLLISGGSDCHGTASTDAPNLGLIRLPYHHVERIKEAIRQRAAVGREPQTEQVGPVRE